MTLITLLNIMIMATVTLGGNKVNLKGTFPAIGSEAPAFTLVKSDLSELSLQELKGKRVVLNIFPSLDTKVCAMSVRKFNTMAAEMANTVVLAISKDLPSLMPVFVPPKESITLFRYRLSAIRNSGKIMAWQSPTGLWPDYWQELSLFWTKKEK